jgi:hypothetical protein
MKIHGQALYTYIMERRHGQAEKLHSGSSAVRFGLISRVSESASQEP